MFGKKQSKSMLLLLLSIGEEAGYKSLDVFTEQGCGLVQISTIYLSR
jgi:hypothetical protein